MTTTINDGSNNSNGLDNHMAKGGHCWDLSCRVQCIFFKLILTLTEKGQVDSIYQTGFADSE